MMAFGCQEDVYDIHRIGFDSEFLRDTLIDFGFCDVERVEGFGFFTDHSTTKFATEIGGGQREAMPLSINVKAKKCKGPEIYNAGEINEHIFKCACYSCFDPDKDWDSCTLESGEAEGDDGY